MKCTCHETSSVEQTQTVHASIQLCNCRASNVGVDQLFGKKNCVVSFCCSTRRLLAHHDRGHRGACGFNTQGRLCQPHALGRPRPHCALQQFPLPRTPAPLRPNQREQI